MLVHVMVLESRIPHALQIEDVTEDEGRGPAPEFYSYRQHLIN